MIAAKCRMPNPLTPERVRVDDDTANIRYASIISTHGTMALVCGLSGPVLVTLSRCMRYADRLSIWACGSFQFSGAFMTEGHVVLLDEQDKRHTGKYAAHTLITACI